MGNLPKAKCPVDTIDIDGEPVEVRGMTRGEVTTLMGMKDESVDKSDAFALSCGAGVSTTEAAEWLASAPMVVSQSLLEAVLRLSGLMDGQGKD
jgi:hypothetical protein